MTYANYGGYSYMGIDRPALVTVFKDLRRQGFAARLGLSQNDGDAMKFVEPYGVIRPNQSGGVWTLASDENWVWHEGSGPWNAQYGSYQPLEVQCSGQVMHQELRGSRRWTAQQVAGYVCGVMEIHGLHPYVDLDEIRTPVQIVTIKLYPSTRLHAMTDDDREAQRNREARRHSDLAESYVDRYAKTLCDQGVLRSHEGENISERLAIRQQSIDALLIELSHNGRFTPEEQHRILVDGAHIAEVRLRCMLNDVIDGGGYGNARAAEYLRLGSTATMAFPCLT